MGDCLMTHSLPHENCDLCGALADREEAFHIAGRDTGNFSLPPAARALLLVQDQTGVSSRAKQLKKCPRCETYYWFWTDYEFLVGGTEDEQFLIRLRPDQVNDYLKPSPEERSEPSQHSTEESTAAATPKVGREQAQGARQIFVGQDDFHRLLTAYDLFEVSKGTYEKALEQRYYRPADGYPAPDGITKLHGDVKDAWNALCGLLEKMNLRETAYADCVLPKRKKGGKRKYRRLINWLTNGCHQLQSLVPTLAKNDYRQLLQELLNEEMVNEWGFGRKLRAGAHTERGIPQPNDTATIVSPDIPIPYFTGFFVVDFSKNEVRLMAVDQKTPAEQQWQLQPAVDWWPRAYCCDWPIFGKERN
jgi:hypothetical protein